MNCLNPSTYTSTCTSTSTRCAGTAPDTLRSVTLRLQDRGLHGYRGVVRPLRLPTRAPGGLPSRGLCEPNLVLDWSVSAAPLNLALIVPGALLTLTFHHADGDRTVPVRVTWTEVRKEGVYFGYTPDHDNPWKFCAWGCAMAYTTLRPFGLHAIATTPANTTPGTRTYPRPLVQY